MSALAAASFLPWPTLDRTVHDANGGPDENGSAARAGRDPNQIDLVANPFIVIGSTSKDLAESRLLIRQHISYYARTYSRVLAHHG